MALSDSILNNIEKVTNYFKQNFAALVVMVILSLGLLFKLFQEYDNLREERILLIGERSDFKQETRAYEQIIKGKIDSLNSLLNNVKRREALLDRQENAVIKDTKITKIAKAKNDKKTKFDSLIESLKNNYNDIEIGAKYVDDDQYMKNYRKLEKELELAILLAKELGEYENYKPFFASFYSDFNTITKGKK